MGVMCGVWGALRPQFHTELNMLITGDNRATVLSAENLLANMIISVVLPPLGAIHDALSFSTAVFVSAPLIFGIYSVVRHVPPRPPAHSIFLLSPSLFLLLSPSLFLSGACRADSHCPTPPLPSTARQAPCPCLLAAAAAT